MYAFTTFRLSKSNPRSKGGSSLSVSKDPAKTSRSVGRVEAKKTGSSSTKSDKQTSVRRETKPPGGQSLGKHEGDKRQAKDSRSSGGSSKSKGQNLLHKESSSKRISEKDIRRQTESKHSKEKDKDNGRTTKEKRQAKPENSKDDKQAVAQEEVRQKESSGQLEYNFVASKVNNIVLIIMCVHNVAEAVLVEQEAEEKSHPQPMVEVLEDLGEDDYQYDEEFEVSKVCTNCTYFY